MGGQCCGRKAGSGRRAALEGIAYGLVPHMGCIAFIIGSVLGVSLLTGMFLPLLMNPYFGSVHL